MKRRKSKMNRSELVHSSGRKNIIGALDVLWLSIQPVTFLSIAKKE
jgi:hypothetical protein